jgi:hypothetical protein
MTIVVVKNGVMVVDSLVSLDGIIAGEALKWRYVDMALGGGVVAGSGPIGAISAAMDDIAKRGTDADLSNCDDCGFLWVDNSLILREWNGKGWYELVAPYSVIGQGEQVAIGALAQGATAREAVDICCRLMPSSCGCTIYEFDLTNGSFCA